MTVEKESNNAESSVQKWSDELHIAFGLLTRLPLQRREILTTATMASAIWAYPIAGAVVGGLAAISFYFSSLLGFGDVVSVLCALAIMTIVTGALHEDGLADFFDGIGGGQSREDSLIIMRDSRIGTYGVVALIFAVGLEAALLLDVSRSIGIASMPFVLIGLGAASRSSVAIPLITLEPAREDGLGAAAQPASPVTALIAALIALAIVSVCLGLSATIAVVLGVVAGSTIVTFLAHIYIGGVTGDVCGAAIISSFLGGLMGFVLGAAL